MEVGQSQSFARSQGPNPYKIMERLDADTNGKLSAEEIKGTKFGEKIGEDFASVDKNEDGGISSDEMFEFRAEQREAREARGPSQLESVTAALIATLSELTDTLSSLAEQGFGTEEVEAGEAAVAEPELVPAEAEAVALEEAAEAGATDVASLIENAVDDLAAAVEALEAEPALASGLGALDLEALAEEAEAEAFNLATAAAEAEPENAGLSSEEIALSLAGSVVEATTDESEEESPQNIAQALYTETQSLLGDVA